MSLCDTMSAVAEARLLHASSEPGYFCLSRLKPGPGRGVWRDRLRPLSVLDAAAQAARNVPDVYISQASFWTPTRAVATTQSLRCAFVDLDTYNVGIEPDEQAIQAVIRIAVEAGLPAPSHITSSGRGLYAKWVFSSPIGSHDLQAWQALQEVLISLYRPMGADSKARDAARVLRLPESINSKSGRHVEVVHNSGRTHCFRELATKAAQIQIPEAAAGARQRSRSVMRIKPGDAGVGFTDLGALAQYSLSREPIMMRHGSLQRLNWLRFQDLLRLVGMRGGIHKGARDITLFWMTSFLALSNVITPHNLWHEVQALLRGFPLAPDFDPREGASLGTLVRRIQAHDRGERIAFRGRHYTPVYTPTNETLLNMLEITPDEQQTMLTIISGDEKLRRADLKVPGRAERRQERSAERKAAATLRAQGHSIRQIADALHRSPSTISGWLQEDPRAGQPYVEQRGRRACRRPQPGHGPAPGTAGGLSAFSPAELARRSKIGCARTWLKPEARLGQRDLQAVLDRRRQHQAWLAQIRQEQLGLREQVFEMQEAQAALKTQLLLGRLREKVVARDTAGPISMARGAQHASTTKTGPPEPSTLRDEPRTE